MKTIHFIILLAIALICGAISCIISYNNVLLANIFGILCILISLICLALGCINAMK